MGGSPLKYSIFAEIYVRIHTILFHCIYNLNHIFFYICMPGLCLWDARYCCGHLRGLQEQWANEAMYRNTYWVISLFFNIFVMSNFLFFINGCKGSLYYLLWWCLLVWSWQAISPWRSWLFLRRYRLCTLVTQRTDVFRFRLPVSLSCRYLKDH